MDLFDLLILLLFVGAPLIEGVLRKRRSAERESEEGSGAGAEAGRQERGDSAAPGRTGVPSRTSREWESDGWNQAEDVAGGAEAAGAEPGRGDAHASASEMVPDDLWEVLTGERRSRSPAPEREEAEPSWSEDSVAVQDGLGEMAETDWVATPWDEEPDDDEGPVSLEVIGPEAVSLEQPLQDPEERHRDFHDKMDSLIEATSIGSGGSRPDPAGPLRAALQDPSEVRQAVLLSEILGPPAGLRGPL